MARPPSHGPGQGGAHGTAPSESPTTGARGEPSLIAGLSRWEDDEASLLAAKEVLAFRDPDAGIDRLYRTLLPHKTLPAALHHLERAGGDLERLTLSADLFGSLRPLNQLVGPPARGRSGRMPLSELRHRLDRHRELLLEAAIEILDRTEGRHLQIGGMAWGAAYEGYGHRLSYDVDAMAPDLRVGLEMLEALLDLGFGVLRFKLSKVGDPGLACFAAGRTSEDGHMIRIDVLAGGYDLGDAQRPLWAVGPFTTRARQATLEGRTTLVPSPEDLLLMVALRSRQKERFIQRDVNDVRFLLATEERRLDWDYLVRAAATHGARGALHHLTRLAEADAGRPLVPSAVRSDLSPRGLDRAILQAAFGGGIRGALLRSNGGAQRFPDKRLMRWWSSYHVFRYARPRLGIIGASGYVATYRQSRRLFSLRCRLGTSSRWTFRLAVPLVRALTPNYGAFCEFIRTPVDPRAQCLSRTAALRRRPPKAILEDGGAVLRRVVDLAVLPPGESPVAGGCGDAPRDHRCWRYVFSLGRIHSSPSSGVGS